MPFNLVGFPIVRILQGQLVYASRAPESECTQCIEPIARLEVNVTFTIVMNTKTHILVST